MKNYTIISVNYTSKIAKYFQKREELISDS